MQPKFYNKQLKSGSSQPVENIKLSQKVIYYEKQITEYKKIIREYENRNCNE